MKHKLLVGLSAALATVSTAAMLLLAAPATAQTPATRTIKVATIAVTNSPWHKALLKFKEIVDADSKGRYTVSLYPDGQLGDIPQLLSAMQIGTVDMAYFGLSSISYVRGGEALNVIYVPYLFKDGEWAEKILNNDEFQSIYAKVATSSGVRVFGAWGQRSPRAMQTTKGPVKKPEDLRGMRIRIPPIPLLKATFDRLNVQVASMGVLEIYNALSRGMVDGQDNGFDLAMPPKFYEAAKYWSATDHVYEVVGWFVSERLWKTLPPADQEMFKKASREAGKVATDLEKKYDHDSIAVMQAAGVTYTVPDKAAFRAAVAGVEKPFDGKLWPAGLVERIHKIQGDK
ncbi:TRAP transporter substrate-binding protein [Herbaspirillum autotrophicum]|uniref:TRAP transporter substrate-binding protein n=1 Tax=Herbaspirillum autotrophicum TaxID=180195 RepID=UPI00067BEDFC|nr:TRAP transporter substrate-binding protein [Herbaspirillum autotrophicum]